MYDLYRLSKHFKLIIKFQHYLEYFHNKHNKKIIFFFNEIFLLYYISCMLLKNTIIYQGVRNVFFLKWIILNNIIDIYYRIFIINIFIFCRIIYYVY